MNKNSIMLTPEEIGEVIADEALECEIRAEFASDVGLLFAAVARAQLKKVYEEIKKVENPYKTMTAFTAGKTPQQMCGFETGFEDARQQILAEIGKEVGE